MISPRFPRSIFIHILNIPLELSTMINPRAFKSEARGAIHIYPDHVVWQHGITFKCTQSPSAKTRYEGHDFMRIADGTLMFSESLVFKPWPSFFFHAVLARTDSVSRFTCHFVCQPINRSFTCYFYKWQICGI
ncbi:hypothetical protein OPIT5_04840 [Opitutaceae bacterium TAV5]|nr:hypothetical protein OPIT5_04840 [Opitutaceae bacterium TAV5]